MSKITLDRETFKALASESRLDILQALDAHQRTGTELATELDLNKATVHEHLRVLETVGLIERLEEGRKWIYYRLSWQGRKLLHPGDGILFNVMLGLSALAFTGGIVRLFMLLGDVNSESPSSDFPMGTSFAENDTMESSKFAAAPADAPMDDGFFDTGGWWVVTYLMLALLFLATSVGVRKYRREQKGEISPNSP